MLHMDFRETLGRMSEINQLKWDDVNFREKYIILKTRRKKNRSLTPRSIPMTQKLFEVLSHRYTTRNQSIPWIFWHRYWSVKENRFIEGPYKERKTIMKSLCKKANVPYFRYHAIRHSGASVMEEVNIPIGSIQRILGHENRSTTEIYLPNICNSERKAMLLFEDARKNAHTEKNLEKQSFQQYG